MKKRIPLLSLLVGLSLSAIPFSVAAQTGRSDGPRPESYFIKFKQLNLDGEILKYEVSKKSWRFARSRNAKLTFIVEARRRKGKTAERQYTLQSKRGSFTLPAKMLTARKLSVSAVATSNRGSTPLAIRFDQFGPFSGFQFPTKYTAEPQVAPPTLPTTPPPVVVAFGPAARQKAISLCSKQFYGSRDQRQCMSFVRQAKHDFRGAMKSCTAFYNSREKLACVQLASRNQETNSKKITSCTKNFTYGKKRMACIKSFANAPVTDACTSAFYSPTDRMKCTLDVAKLGRLKDAGRIIRQCGKDFRTKDSKFACIEASFGIQH